MGIIERNSWAGWAEVFIIFSKYSQDYDPVAVEHDIIYAGPDPVLVSEEDKARLEQLGWHVSTKVDCFYRFV